MRFVEMGDSFHSSDHRCARKQPLEREDDGCSSWGEKGVVSI